MATDEKPRPEASGAVAAAPLLELPELSPENRERAEAAEAKFQEFAAPKVKEHSWRHEQAMGGITGLTEFWICGQCSAAGGPLRENDTKPRYSPFLAGTPLRNVGDDCDVAKATIDEFVKKYPDYEEYVLRHRSA